MMQSFATFSFIFSYITVAQNVNIVKKNKTNNVSFDRGREEKKKRGIEKTVLPGVLWVMKCNESVNEG